MSLAIKLKMFIYLNLLTVVLFITSCSTANQGQYKPLSALARMVVLPFENNTETPYAGLRASSIARAVLASQGFNVSRLTYKQKDYTAEEIKNLMEIAKSKGYKYAVVGTVNEWRYKTGIDGEPAVSLTMGIIDLDTGETVWNGVSSKSGWGYKSIGVLAQEIVEDLVGSIETK